MSNGIKGDFKSTIVVMYKNGSNITTKCIDAPQALRETFEKIKNSKNRIDVERDSIWRVVTGDEDDSVVYIDTNEVTFLAVQNYVTEEIAVQRLQQKKDLQEVRNAGKNPSPPSRIITPGPRRM